MAKDFARVFEALKLALASQSAPEALEELRRLTAAAAEQWAEQRLL
jgi:hypothetical protein